MSTSLCIASGKGGVGKSTLTANLGVALARRGFSVVIMDADLGLRSQDAFLGLENLVVYDLMDVARKDCLLDQALLACPAAPEKLKLLPAAQFSRARSLEASQLRKILRALKETFDFILVDAPAGIERGLRNILNAGVDETILVVTPDDICLRDAERAAQIIEAKHQPRPRLIVNRLDPLLIQQGEMMPARVISDTLDLSLLGEIPEDPAVYRSILRHSLFLDFDCEARRAVLRVAGRLAGEMIPLPEFGRQPQPLLRRLFSRFFAPKEVTPLDSH